jgi:hypothetical protein
MGWLSFSMHKPVKEWFKEGLGSQYELLDAALVQRTTLYAAIKNKETSEVFCVVYLIRWSPKSWDNFCYKDMTEFSGPGQCNCPKRIMKLLSPLNDENDPNGWAREWRKRVENYWQIRNTINKGGVIKTENPLKFMSGAEYQYFKKIGRTIWAGTLINDKFAVLCPVRVNLAHHNVEKFPVENLDIK